MKANSKIFQYARENKNPKAVSKFRKNFPTLTKSTIRTWVKKNKAKFKTKPQGNGLKFSVK